MTDTLLKCGLSAGGDSLGQTCVDRDLGIGIGKGEVLEDLLDTPLVRTCLRGAKLGLGGVESLEGIGYLLLELLEDRIHGRRITVHRKREPRRAIGAE